MAIDTSRTMEIRVSRWKILALLVGTFVFAAGSTVMAFDRLDGAVPSSYHEFVGFGGTAFFGLGFVAALVAAIRWRGPVITLSPEGIRDIRMSPKLIAWRDVRDITTLSGDDPKIQRAIAPFITVSSGASELQIRKMRFMMLAVAPEIKAGLVAGRRLGKLATQLDHAFGVDGVAINPQQLSVGYDTLYAAARAYWQAAGGGR